MKILNNPYPLETDFKVNLRISVVIGFFVASFLYIFQPLMAWYNYIEIPLSYSIIFGLIAFSINLFFNVNVPKFLEKIYQEESWNVKKEILHNFALVFFIAFFNFCFVKYTSFYTNYEVSFFHQIIQLFGITFLVAVFPVVFVVFYRQNRLLRQFAHQTSTINSSIQEKKDSISSILKINGDGKNENIEIDMNKFIFVKSQANYCEIVIEGKEQTILLRSSMSNILKQLSKKSTYKCHRSYIVNLQKVVNVTGNAQGLRLHFQNLKESVPVSRNLTNEIKQLLIKRS